MKIKVTVVQTEKRRYFDDKKQQMVEYEAENELNGNGLFDNWADVERFVGIVINFFPNTVVKIHIEKEAE